ncbi:unnamed protein product, partial [Mesorhabditis belari]|uniref:AB hydrolase-1 domain-containing protein n=1 Tax=Mesorhabditis belari TaxID=2138241 RepID=A0AAF3EBC2_9BILA
MWQTIKLIASYYFFVGLWSTLTVLNLAFSWIFLRKPIFQRKFHKRPTVLDEDWNHRFIQLSKVRLHYVETGEEGKPLMLLLHGFPEFWYSWRFQLKHFAKDYRVVAVDQRGYGESDAPVSKDAYSADEIAADAKEFIEALGYKNAIVIAHDWGGAIAWRLAAYYPQAVSRLIVLNCPHPLAMGQLFGKTWKQFLRSWYMLMFQSCSLPEFTIAANDFGFLDQIFQGNHYGLKVNPKNFDEIDMEAWKYTFSQQGALTGPINWYRCAMKGKSRLSKNDLIKPPTMIVWGTEDAFLVREGADLSLQFCERARLEFVEGASHWVQQDCPETVNNHIEDFLRE